MSNPNTRKSCVVPKCTNTTTNAPDKLFFIVPKDVQMRKKWIKGMKRLDPFGDKSTVYCCEDHFDLENDMENYIRWKLMGGAIKLKSGIVPHIFECQRPTTVIPERKAAAKRRRKTLIQEASLDQLSSSTSVSHNGYEWVDCGSPDIEIIGESETSHSSNKNCGIDKKIQVRKPDFQASKKYQTDPISEICVTTASSPIKTNVLIKTSPIKANVLSLTNMTDPEASSYKEESEYEDNTSANETNDNEDEDTDDKLKLYMVKGTITSIEKDPKLYLGIPKDSYFCLKMLSDEIQVPLSDIFITLKKIRLNEPYAILGTQFGKSSYNIGQIFKSTVPKVSLFFKEFIVWPSKSKVAQRLPIAFRSRYSNVQSIIDCFEIPIQTPSNLLHQSQTWSEYKGCNTIKYMISCTPDGLVNFVSCGFGGSASDTAIFENCGYITNLSPGMDIMADRGFKNVSNILNQQQCRLIRPSVSANTISTKEEVLEAQTIASLRIHVERVTGRLRDFNMVAPYACVDLRYLSIYDEITTIVCGLINLQIVGEL